MEFPLDVHQGEKKSDELVGRRLSHWTVEGSLLAKLQALAESQQSLVDRALLLLTAIAWSRLRDSSSLVRIHEVRAGRAMHVLLFDVQDTQTVAEAWRQFHWMSESASTSPVPADVDVDIRCFIHEAGTSMESLHGFTEDGPRAVWNVHCEVGAERVRLDFGHDPQRVSPQEADALLQRLPILCESLVAQADARSLSDLVWMTDAERRAALLQGAAPFRL